MKKSVFIITLSVLLLVIGVFAYMLGNSNDKQENNNNTNIKNNASENSNIQENQTITDNEENVIGEQELSENKRIKLSFNNEEVYVSLENNNSVQDLLKMLPLTIKFEDYNNTEKIAMLDTKLDISDAPSGYDPQIGDFAYYAPWENLSVFYKDFRYSNSLIKLGTFENGIEKIQNITDGTEIRIEEVK